VKTEDGTNGKNSVSQEIQKTKEVSSSQLSRVPTVSEQNSKQKLVRTREKRAAKSTFMKSKTII
jgi:hypothetical protein